MSAQQIATVTTVYTFTGGNDGGYPVPGLAQDGDGNLYGVTSLYGAGNLGTIFKVTPAGTFTLLHSFTNLEVVDNPISSLVRGPDGNFYGTDDDVYRVTPTGDFTLFTNYGYGLSDGLTLGPDGNFYGAARTSPQEEPIIVRVSLAGVVDAFSSDNAYRVYPLPFTALTQGGDGNLYGTIDGTGFHFDGGQAFRLTLDGTYTLLYSLPNHHDGSTVANSQLVEGSDGNFYGALSVSPDHAQGELYQLTPDGTYTTLYAFHDDSVSTGENATPPLRIALALGKDGNLYGSTPAGGAQGAGTIFMVTLHPAFFTGLTALNNSVYYLAFPSGNPFGYFSFLSDPNYLYHFDLGYEYVFNANDGQSGVYLYDFKSQGFFYTSPTFPFPFLYDFNLNSVLYYYPNPSNPGRYNTNGTRYFYRFDTGEIISK